MDLPTGGRLVLPWPDLTFIPTIPPFGPPDWLGQLPMNPYFWILVGGFFCAGALALGLSFGDTPQKQLRLRKRKVFWIPLLMTFCIGALVAGAMITRTWVPQMLHGLSALGVVIFFFLVFRFPRLAGIPLGILAAASGVGLFFLVSGAEPLRDGGLIRTRLLSDSKGYWTMESSPRPVQIAAKPRGQWIITEVYRFSTPGLLSLTGAQEWAQVHIPQGFIEDLSRTAMSLVGLGSSQTVAPPDRPQLYHVYDLIKEPKGTWKWRALYPVPK